MFTSHHATNDIHDVTTLLRCCELVLAQVVRGALGDFFIATIVEAVLQVLQRRVLQRLFQVLHGVLRDVGQSQVVVAPDFPDTFIDLKCADE